MNGSCVETSIAPEWLSKLEDRREKSRRAKLGHETGAGAPCTSCESKCPGLDLHFWRKICRNCKCRKDQHTLHDDEASGWAQFDILGQVHSKPTFIRIKASSNEPVKVEWIPPNVTADIAVDYMEMLGSENIPIAGSEAATKRRQQLEYQVPPHDLDATLCDNLSESETKQLEQYVQKLRTFCVGQGKVVRVIYSGNSDSKNIDQSEQSEEKHKNFSKNIYEDIYKILQVSPPAESSFDVILHDLFSNDILMKAIKDQVPCKYPKFLVAFSMPTINEPREKNAFKKLMPDMLPKLRNLDEITINSLVKNGQIYDQMFSILRDKGYDISCDPQLKPMHEFREEYLKNSTFKIAVDNMCNVRSKECCSLTLKYPTRNEMVHNLSEELSVRQMKLDEKSLLLRDFCLPTNVDYERDQVFANILYSKSLREALKSFKENRQLSVNSVVIIQNNNSNIEGDSINNINNLNTSTKRKLLSLGITTKQILQSVVLNAPFYESLFQMLCSKRINYENCQVLKPLKCFMREMKYDKSFYENIRGYITSLPNSMEVAYYPININIQRPLTLSNQPDQEFDLKTKTSNHHTQKTADINNLQHTLILPSLIHDIQDMDMNSEMTSQSLCKNVFEGKSTTSPGQILKCHDCSQSINIGEVVVKTARVYEDIIWHPKCFKCFTCHELLADLVYFFHGGHIYCGRDLAVKLKIPRCRACDELIFTKEYTAAEGATFHIKHFCCFQCDTPLAGQQYVPDDKFNMPLCLNCYKQFYAAACQSCRLPIGPADQGVNWGEMHWHDTCFVCAGRGCSRPLLHRRFCVKQNMPFCSTECIRSVIF